MKMRQSLLNTAQTCQHRLAYYLDPNIPYTGGVVRAMGTAIHAAHEAYYTHRQQTGEIHTTPELGLEWIEAATLAFDGEVEKVGESFDWVYQPETSREALRMMDRKGALAMIGQAIRTYHKEGHYWGEDYEVLAVEWYFDRPFTSHDDWSLSGTLDLILRESSTGKVLLVDHKNVKKKPQKGKYSAHKTPQASFYLHAVNEWMDEIGLRVPERPTFWYDVLAFDGSGFWRSQEQRTIHQIEATMTEAGMLASLIDRGGPYMPNVQSFLCSKAYCDFWSLCPFGETLHDNPQPTGATSR